MALVRAVKAPVDLLIVLPCLLNSVIAISEVTEKNPVLVGRHEGASRLVDFVISIQLRVLIDVVVGHSASPVQFALSRAHANPSEVLDTKPASNVSLLPRSPWRRFGGAS
jgi:hypothetical protein